MERLFVGLTSADRWDAHLILVSVVSFDARLKICNTLMGRRRKLKTARQWVALYNKLSRKYPKRSELAHGTAVQINDKVRLVPYFTLGQTMKRYVGKDAKDVEPIRGLSPREIRERAKSFRTLAVALGTFSRDLLAEQEQLRESRA